VGLNVALGLSCYLTVGQLRETVVDVILFYALLIGGLGLAISAYVTFLILPVGLIARKFGLLAGAIFAMVLLAVLFVFYRPPLGSNVTLSFVPPGMRANLFIVQMVQDPPFAMLIAGAAVSAAGRLLLLLARLLRRA
jgi:hypothetical protein